MKELFGEKRARECLMKMQKSILASTLNIARCFKVMSEKLDHSSITGQD